jgi:hypothetical protein
MRNELRLSATEGSWLCAGLRSGRASATRLAGESGFSRLVSMPWTVRFTLPAPVSILATAATTTTRPNFRLLTFGCAPVGFELSTPRHLVHSRGTHHPPSYPTKCQRCQRRCYGLNEGHLLPGGLEWRYSQQPISDGYGVPHQPHHQHPRTLDT